MPGQRKPENIAKWGRNPKGSDPSRGLAKPNATWPPFVNLARREAARAFLRVRRENLTILQSMRDQGYSSSFTLPPTEAAAS